MNVEGHPNDMILYIHWSAGQLNIGGGRCALVYAGGAVRKKRKDPL
jgi:hypothetical protein